MDESRWVVVLFVIDAFYKKKNNAEYRSQSISTSTKNIVSEISFTSNLKNKYILIFSCNENSSL